MSETNSTDGDRPSDTEAAHATDGGAVRNPDKQGTTRDDPSHGSLDGHPSKDPIAEYGDRAGAQDSDRKP
jgi:hypothetical protein